MIKDIIVAFLSHGVFDKCLIDYCYDCTYRIIRIQFIKLIITLVLVVILALLAMIELSLLLLFSLIFGILFIFKNLFSMSIYKLVECDECKQKSNRERSKIRLSLSQQSDDLRNPTSSPMAIINFCEAMKDYKKINKIYSKQVKNQNVDIKITSDELNRILEDNPIVEDPIDDIIHDNMPYNKKIIQINNAKVTVTDPRSHQEYDIIIYDKIRVLFNYELLQDKNWVKNTYKKIELGDHINIKGYLHRDERDRTRIYGAIICD